MAIAQNLLRERADLSVQFASYGAGTEAYRKCGFPVIDLVAPDAPSFLEMVVSVTQLVTRGRPDLVVAHEEFAALIAAKVAAVPCVFINDFFMDPTTLFMQSLKYAAEVIFTGERGLLQSPRFFMTRCTVSVERCARSHGIERGVPLLLMSSG